MVAKTNQDEPASFIIAEPDPARCLIQRQRNRAAIAALRSLRQAGDEEQLETWEYLRRVLDEDRPAHRKLFS